MSALPLEGLRVLDASTFLAGPICCSLLADWGADVVKVEPPGGDPARTLGGPVVGPGMTPTFVSGNRGKRAIAVDYGRPEGRDVVARLAACSDVVVHNQRDDVAARLGLEPTALSARGSTAVVCSISAFGPVGAYAGRPALDSMIQAMTGMATLTGETAGIPMRAGPQVIDVGTGMTAAGAVAAALLGRERTGVPRHVSVSLYDVGLLFNAGFVVMRSADGRTPPRLANRSHPLLADQFATADGFVVVAVWDTRRWSALCEALGVADMLDDPDLADNDGRLRHYDRVGPRLERAIRGWTSAALRDVLDDLGVLCCITADLDAVVADAHTRTSGAIYDEARVGPETIQMAAGPVRIDGARAVAGRPCPRLGEHSVEILGEWLLADDAESNVLLDDGVVIPDSADDRIS
ncbi:CoA transferase [Paraconexibacter antarcticus]|uniref:CoA transferase n=1 Tax=Paraconexibacter antarcticus TaxID=2949664 RepID=A0ABY5DXE9_9ACTN|nr:CoA transferase [Paraconexibacter antarcticus]UTI66229.1 CoA transferase [Paraconexibacter antarcticus]